MLWWGDEFEYCNGCNSSFERKQSSSSIKEFSKLYSKATAEEFLKAAHEKLTDIFRLSKDKK